MLKDRAPDAYHWGIVEEVKQAANEYYKAIQVLEKLIKKKWGGDGKLTVPLKPSYHVIPKGVVEMSIQQGVHVVRAHQRSGTTCQTPGMKREAGVAPETTGNQGLWMGLVTTPAGMTSGWHHHGDCETGI